METDAATIQVVLVNDIGARYIKLCTIHLTNL